MSDLNLKTKVRQALEETLNRFRPNNHAFLFDLFIDGEVIVQVVHHGYIETIKKSSHGFGMAIYLVFDLSLDRYVADHDEFQTLSIFKDFHSFSQQGIQCYAFDMVEDISKGTELIAAILEDLYGYYKADSIEISVQDQGPR